MPPGRRNRDAVTNLSHGRSSVWACEDGSGVQGGESGRVLYGQKGCVAEHAVRAVKKRSQMVWAREPGEYLGRASEIQHIRTYCRTWLIRIALNEIAQHW